MRDYFKEVQSGTANKENFNHLSMRLFSIYHLCMYSVARSYLSATLSYTVYNSAGWMATTLNYSWPLAFGLFSMISIKKLY